MSVSNADHHVQVVIDLLEAADAQQWTPDTPDIRNYWDDSSSERGNGADMPAVLYVWSPTGSTLERFSSDGDKFDRQCDGETACRWFVTVWWPRSTPVVLYKFCKHFCVRR